MINKLNIQLLLTGDELMSGDVLDSNSCMMADVLKQQGLVFNRKVTVGDNLRQLVEEIESLSKAGDVLIINGGLGPTVDDRTAEALGLVIKQPLIEQPQAITHLEQWCESRGFALNGPNRKQGLLPKGVDLLTNPIGSAPGFSFTHNECLIICTPGVPGEAKSMLQQSILPLLADMNPGGFTRVLRWQLFGIGESSVQRLVNEKLADWPSHIELGFRAAFPQLELKLTVHDAEAAKDLPQWQDKLKALLGAHIIGEGSIKLPQLVVSLLKERQQQLTLAESCTGGLIASKITSVAGASAVFEAGVVSYSNQIKQRVLGVKQKTLMNHGAVSEPVVQEMALGALDLSAADWTLAVSGIAGPGGGTDDKPVGTVWLAWGNRQELRTQKLFYPGRRDYFQTYVAYAGLDLLRRKLLGIEDVPFYFSAKK